ncbi:MAG: hypothetical protein QUU85_17225 [Candidatus Eisenbacteria bacterium]|nr:hypothetical protein [Candidatus Eisenbacteria bacterium]
MLLASPAEALRPDTLSDHVRLSPERDRLPFAGNPLPARYPSFGIGYGVGLDLSSLDGVEKSFQRIEDRHRAEGWVIQDPPDIALDPMQLWTVAIRVEERLEFAWQIGRSGGDENQLNLKGLLVTGHYTPGRDPAFQFSASIGAGWYGFHFRKTYGDKISIVDSGGHYTSLDHVTLDGGGNYFSAGAGMTAHPTLYSAIDFYAQYLRAPDESTSAGDDSPRLSVNLGGLLVGVRLSIFHPLGK